MAFPGLLEGQRNQPKPHADLFPRSWSKLLLTLWRLRQRRQTKTRDVIIAAPALKPTKL